MPWASKEPDRMTFLLAVCALFATIAGGGGLLNLAMKDPLPAMPAGIRVLSGLVLDWDASADGRVVAAEIRGAHRQPGDAREHLELVRTDGSEENLGYEATLPAVSPDGKWIAWLASRERGSRLGPGRIRAVAGGPVVSTPAAMPPFVFGPYSVAFFTGYDSTLGLGTLSRLAFGDLTPRRVATDVLAGRFAVVGTSGLVAERAPPPGSCSSVHVSPDGEIRTDALGFDCRENPGPPFGCDRPRAAPALPWCDRTAGALEAGAGDGITVNGHFFPDAREIDTSPFGWIAVIVRSRGGRESVRLLSPRFDDERELATDAEHAEVRWTSNRELLLLWSRPSDWTDPRNGLYRVAP